MATVREIREALAAFDQDLDLTIVMPVEGEDDLHCDPALPRLGLDNEGDKVVFMEITP